MCLGSHVGRCVRWCHVDSSDHTTVPDGASDEILIDTLPLARSRHRGLRTWIAMLTWALASPSASAPDDDLHVASIYCLHNSTTCRSDDWVWPWGSIWWAADPADRIGPEYEGARKAYRDLWPYKQPRALPCYVANGDSWYNPDAAVPADFVTQEDPNTDTPASLDDLGYYPSPKYRFASLFTSDTIRESVVHCGG